MTTSMNVGQRLPIKIEFIDTAGNVMSPPPAVDGLPSWTNSDNSVGTLEIAADALSATETAVAAGNVTASVSLSIAGVNASASLDIAVVAAVPVFATIRLTPGTPA